MRINPMDLHKRGCFVLLIVTQMILLTTGYGYSESMTFKDVSVNFWANEAIHGMYDDGVIKGYPDGTFRPNDSVTREQFAVMICNAFNLQPQTPAVPTFMDVGGSRWSYGYIEAAKDYLTGYQAGDQKSRFNPTGLALREDVAVALVKVMKLEMLDKDPEAFLRETFRDVESISPGLYKEVSAAVYFKLVSGLPNGLFEGDQPINRASVATIIFRAMKTSNKTNALQNQLTVALPETTNIPMVTMSLKTELGNRIYINNEQIAMNGVSREIDLELMKGQGNYVFEVRVITPQGKVLTVTKSVLYVPDAPVIEVDSMPLEVLTQSVVIKGSIKDANDGQPSLWIEDQKVPLQNEGRFEHKVILKEGMNPIKLKGVNRLGKMVEQTVTLKFIASGPNIDFSGLPTETSEAVFSVKGRISDQATGNFYKLAVFLMDRELSFNYQDGTFSKDIVLKEGLNIVKIRATNAIGKTTEATHEVTFTPKAPEIFLYDTHETVTNSQYKLLFRLEDYYDYRLTLLINDVEKGSFYRSENQSLEVKLAPGENTLMLRVINSKGKEATLKKKVIFNPAAPDVKVLSSNTSAYSNYELKGTLVESTGIGNVQEVKVNGRTMTFQGSSFNYPFELIEGINDFQIEVLNSFGMKTLVKHTVIYVKPSPVLFIQMPDVTSEEGLVVSGSLIDVSDPRPTLMINGEVIQCSSSGFWNHTVVLIKGENTIVFVAKNKLGKTTVVEKKIVLK